MHCTITASLHFCIHQSTAPQLIEASRSELISMHFVNLWAHCINLLYHCDVQLLLPHAHYLDCVVVGDAVMNVLSSEMLCGDAVNSFNVSIDNQTGSFESHNCSFESHKRPGADCRTLYAVLIVAVG